MLLQNKHLMNSVRVLILGTAPLFLAACHSDLGPFPMPTGYAHHDKAYQAPPGPEPVLKKIEYMRVPQSVPSENCEPETAVIVPPKMMPPVAVVPVDGGAWAGAADELVARLISGFGRMAEPVYILPAPVMGPAEIGFEGALRGALVSQNLPMADAPGMGPYTLRYAISPLPVGEDGRAMVTLTLAGPSGVLQEVSGIYSPGIVVMPAPVVVDMAPDGEPGPAAPSEPMPIGPLN